MALKIAASRIYVGLGKDKMDKHFVMSMDLFQFFFHDLRACDYQKLHCCYVVRL